MNVSMVNEVSPTIVNTFRNASDKLPRPGASHIHSGLSQVRVCAISDAVSRRNIEYTLPQITAPQKQSMVAEGNMPDV